MDGEHSSEVGYISKDWNDHVQKDGQDQQDEEQSATTKLLNIINIFSVLQI